jgi:thiamine-phosphate pyrophosphorylase
LSEALRSIEEYGKIVDPRFARAIEALRYRGYELERRLLLRRRANERFAGVKLYVLLTEALCRGDWFATAQAALDGGADCLQLREKRLSDRELIARARRIAAHCRQRGALFLVNDRPDIAAVSGADGVHLGQDDMTVADARRLLPAGSIVGCSTHTIEQVAAALAASPDYIAVGPMFSTETKPQDHIAGLATLGEARVASTLPLVAIGGIDCSNVERVVATAPCAICVCGAAIGAVDVAGACRQLRAAIDSSTVSGVL